MSYLQDIYKYIKSGETNTQNLGLEIEHFVVDEYGNQISFDEITALIKEVGERIGAEISYVDGHPVGYSTGTYAISIEPACQFEISISPYSDISVIESVYREFIALWEPVFAAKGYRIITGGVLPNVETGKITPDDLPLSPKKRYEYMDRYFRKSGKYGRYMMRASASTQISVDYSSEADLTRKLRVLQIISPILAIMMENKAVEDSTLPGNPDKTHLLRLQIWDGVDPARTGFFPGSFDDGFGYDKIAEAVYRTPLILLTDNGISVYVDDKNAEDLETEQIIYPGEDDEERRKNLVEHILSMGFFHFRIKKYIEIRVADSVPIEKALRYAALIKGIVYSEDNLTTLETELVDIDEASKVQEAIEAIERDGNEAVIYHGLTAAQWASHLCELASVNWGGAQ